MFDINILLRSSFVGVVLNVFFVLLEAIFPVFPAMIGLLAAMFATMMISAVAGLLYARDLDKGYSPGALGGLIAGLVSTFAGLAVATLLQVPTLFPLGVGTVIGTGIGAIGGVFGQMSANMRKLTGRL